MQSWQAYRMYVRVFMNGLLMFFLFLDDEITLHTLYTLLRVSVDAGCNGAGLKRNRDQPCLISEVATKSEITV